MTKERLNELIQKRLLKQPYSPEDVTDFATLEDAGVDLDILEKSAAEGVLMGEATPISPEMENRPDDNGPSLAQMGVDLGVEQAGSMLGTMAGTPYGPPGRLLGSGLGAVAGLGGLDVGRRAGVIPGKPMENPLKELGITFGANVLGQKFADRQVGGMQNMVQKNIFKGAEDVDKPFKGIKGAVTPIPQRTDSGLLDVIGNILDASLGAGERGKKLVAGNIKILRGKIDTLIDGTIAKATTTDLREATRQVLRKSYGSFNKIGELGYNIVDTNLTNLGLRVRTNIDDMFDTATLNRLKTGIGDAKFTGQDLTFGDLARLKQFHYGKDTKKIDALLDRALTNLGNKANISLREYLDKVTKESPDLITEALASARKVTESMTNAVAFAGKDMTRQFSETFMAKLAQGKPDLLYKELKNMEHGPTIDFVRNSLETASKSMSGKPKLWARIQGHFLDDLARTTPTIRIKNVGEVINGDRLLQELGRLDKKGILAKYFPAGSGEKELELFKQFAKSIAINQRKQEQAAGGMAVQLIQSGMAIKVIQTGALGILASKAGFGEALAGSIIVFGGPNIMARIFTNPKFIKAMVEGGTLPSTMDNMLGVANKVMTTLIAQGVDAGWESATEERVPLHIGGATTQGNLTRSPQVANRSNPLTGLLGGGGANVQ